MRNIELKARYPDLSRAAAICQRLGAKHVWTRRQTDTYFRVPEGRLKLRVHSPGEAVLVSYQRPDTPGARESVYEITPVASAEETLPSLAARYGVAARVEKTRRLFQLANVRIHLDEVEGLGTFVELEAVMGPEDDEARSHGELERLMAEFGIEPCDLIGGSYCDLGDPIRGA